MENALPYVLNGTEYTTTGTYTQLLENANGCDSTITLNLTVYMNVTGDAEQTICESQLPYTWNEVEFTAAGTASALLAGQGSHGEDSTVNMTLVVNPEYNVTDELAICDNGRFYPAGTRRARGGGSRDGFQYVSNVKL